MQEFNHFGDCYLTVLTFGERCVIINSIFLQHVKQSGQQLIFQVYNAFEKYNYMKNTPRQF
jgi:hypothetical protein